MESLLSMFHIVCPVNLTGKAVRLTSLSGQFDRQSRQIDTFVVNLTSKVVRLTILSSQFEKQDRQTD